MRIICQVVRRGDGVRSPGAECERDVFAGVLRDLLDRGDLSEDDYVLVLMEDVGDRWDVSQAPLMGVGRFVSEFGVAA